MSLLKKMITLTTLITIASLSPQRAEADAYVTDTGGYAYDECRACTNLAPAIALGTVAIVGIIAIAVQNSHGHHHGHFDRHRHNHRHNHRNRGHGARARFLPCIPNDTSSSHGHY